MQTVTVESLYNSLGSLIKKGEGKKKVMVINDDEGNGMHEIFFATTSLKDWDSESFWGMDLHGVSPKDARENYILIG